MQLEWPNQSDYICDQFIIYYTPLLHAYNQHICFQLQLTYSITKLFPHWYISHSMSPTILLFKNRYFLRRSTSCEPVVFHEQDRCRELAKSMAPENLRILTKIKNAFPKLWKGEKLTKCEQPLSWIFNSQSNRKFLLISQQLYIVYLKVHYQAHSQRPWPWTVYCRPKQAKSIAFVL